MKTFIKVSRNTFKFGVTLRYTHEVTSNVTLLQTQPLVSDSPSAVNLLADINVKFISKQQALTSVVTAFDFFRIRVRHVPPCRLAASLPGLTFVCVNVNIHRFPMPTCKAALNCENCRWGFVYSTLLYKLWKCKPSM